MNNKYKKGMTLAEITVALGVVAIMITMVVSFSVMLGDRVELSGDILEQHQDLSVVESAVEGWINTMTAEHADFIVDADAPTMITTAPGEGEVTDVYSLSFAYGTLSGSLPGDRTVTITTRFVQSVEFNTMKNGDDILFFCTVKLKDNSKHTFCVNPRVGESAGGTQDETA